MWRIDKKIQSFNKIWHILTVRNRLYKCSHPVIPRMELITWPNVKNKLFVTCWISWGCGWNYFHPNLCHHLLCDRPFPIVPQQGSGSVKHRRRRRITFLIYSRKKCIVIKPGAAIVLLSSSSCKSQSQQLIKEKRNLMTKKLKTKNLQRNKSWSPHLMGHKNLDFKSF